MFNSPEFWFSVLGLIGAARIIEALLMHFLSRGERRVEHGMASLEFMNQRLEAMQDEIDRQHREIATLKGKMNDMEMEQKRLRDTLYEVTETVERHGNPDVVQRVRAIPGVPNVGTTIGLGD